ncbi:MAG: chemotaxis-specific protein-glutamate methyltransferase CheB [Deltaproteobacteria bacterium]|nr:chemotaxis-specific protein-glutamate methyltransferase CheB [Deltaproteobacteria bacterium]
MINGQLRILVVDDSAYNRKMVRSMLLEMEEVASVEVVSDGETAIRTVMTDPPDLITLDLNMPRMDGFTFLRWLMQNHPLPVVVVSADGGEKNVFKALDLGALDFVVKPRRYASERIIEIKEELQTKVRAVGGQDMAPYLGRLRSAKPVRERVKAPRRPGTKIHPAGVLVIGASTGGPSAIQRVLTQLPSTFPLPVIVVQHMPPVFTKQFAMRLGKNTAFEAKEAEDGDFLTPGLLLVVPGGYHLEITGSPSVAVKLRKKRKGDRFVPSIDITMESAAIVFGKRSLGVLLTGMGNDGAHGMLEIRNAGGRTIAESEESTVVFGMPKAAIRNGAAEVVLPLNTLSGRIEAMAMDICRLKNESSDARNRGM